MGHRFPVEPFAEHVPDSGPDEDHLKPDSVEQGAGFLDLGFYVNGHRVVLAQLKAGAFDHLFEDSDPRTGKPGDAGDGGSKSSSSSSTSSTGTQPADGGSSSSSSEADAAKIAELEAKIAELEAANASGSQSDTQPPAQ